MKTNLTYAILAAAMLTLIGAAADAAEPPLRLANILPDPMVLQRDKAARIAAVIADLRQSDKDLHSRRGGNPEIDKKLAKLEAALKAVEAEIDKLAN